MEALLTRATKGVSLLSRPGAGPDCTEAKQSSQELRSTYHALASQVQTNPLCIGPSEKKQVWELACRIWVSLPAAQLSVADSGSLPLATPACSGLLQNFCVNVGNSGEAVEAWQAQLRHTARRATLCSRRRCCRVVSPHSWCL